MDRTSPARTKQPTEPETDEPAISLLDRLPGGAPLFAVDLLASAD
jgi:hypothetical protein